MESTALALLFGLAAAVLGVVVLIGTWIERREKRKLSRVQENEDHSSLS
jgi:hypothetical protein